MRVKTIFTISVPALAIACGAAAESAAPFAPSYAPLASANSGTTARVNGSAHFLFSPPDVPPPEDLDIHVTISAHLGADGTSRGSAHVFFRRPDGALRLQLREEVTCLSFDGSTAWVGTVVVKENLSEGQPSRLGRPVVWQVEDLGVGQDRLQRQIDAPDCTARPTLGLVPSSHGDVHVVPPS